MGETQGRRGKGDVRMKTKLGVMQPQAKECLKPLEVGRDKKEFSPRMFSTALLTSWFQASGHQNSERKNVLLFETTWLVVIYYGRCRKLTHLLNLFFWILYIFWIFTNISSHSVSLISNILVLRILGSRILAPMWNIEFIMSLQCGQWEKMNAHKTINEQYLFIY